MRQSNFSIIDFGPYFNRPDDELQSTADQFRNALENIGFFIMINPSVSAYLIERTFAELKRFHDQDIETKMAVKMNEHHNGYMPTKQYAIWTSEVVVQQ